MVRSAYAETERLRALLFTPEEAAIILEEIRNHRVLSWPYAHLDKESQAKFITVSESIIPKLEASAADQ